MLIHGSASTQELQEERALTSEPRPQLAPAKLERDELNAMIAQRAYFIAERRGFDPGHDVEDWLQAEAEILDSFTAGVE